MGWRPDEFIPSRQVAPFNSWTASYLSQDRLAADSIIRTGEELGISSDGTGVWRLMPTDEFERSISSQNANRLRTIWDCYQEIAEALLAMPLPSIRMGRMYLDLAGGVTRKRSWETQYPEDNTQARNFHYIRISETELRVSTEQLYSSVEVGQEVTVDVALGNPTRIEANTPDVHEFLG